jgi:hypothetical protein
VGKLEDAMKRHRLDAVGVSYGYGESCQAWGPEVSMKGYVVLYPPEPGVFSGKSLDEALSKVAGRAALSSEQEK